MSAIVTNKSLSYSVILNEGTDSSGNMISKTTNMPSIKMSANVDSVLAVQTAYALVAEAPVYTLKRRTINIVSE